MLKLLTTTIKELLLLQRDRTGLLVLFLMPAILVVIITLVQENIMELTGQKKTEVLFLDLDQGDLGGSLRRQLETGNLELVIRDATQTTPADIRTAVAGGAFQVGIVIPAGASDRFKSTTTALFQPEANTDTLATAPPILLQLFLDPGIMAGLRSGVTAGLEMALTAITLEAKIAALSRTLQEGMSSLNIPPAAMQMEEDRLATLFRRPLLSLSEEQRDRQSAEPIQHNPVQQNVPAWALFGMFFTAIPIAGSILKERGSGIWVRLMALPVSPLLLFAGKSAAYLAVCLCQFLLIALIGALLFPFIGLPAFTIAANLPAVLLTVLFSGLAACGYGIFLGTICNSYEQASTLGATSVVAAAAIGGVMVPVYAMPQTMQRLSIISPLNWGLTAFQDLLLRNATLTAIAPDLGRLFLFFAVCALLAWKFSGRRQ